MYRLKIQESLIWVYTEGWMTIQHIRKWKQELEVGRMEVDVRRSWPSNSTSMFENVQQVCSLWRKIVAITRWQHCTQYFWFSKNICTLGTVVVSIGTQNATARSSNSFFDTIFSRGTRTSESNHHQGWDMGALLYAGVERSFQIVARGW